VENTKNKTLLIIYPGSECVGPFDLHVAETGEHVATMYNGVADYVKRDFYDHQDEAIENRKERFGEVEIKFIDEVDMSVDEFLDRNAKFYSNADDM
jgi:hypothetical protein